jgi:hypothetical protein
MLAGMRSRRHSVERVYTRSSAADDVVLTGSVRWVLKDGKQVDGRFAARAVVNSSGKLRLYQGWAVSNKRGEGLPSLRALGV